MQECAVTVELVWHDSRISDGLYIVTALFFVLDCNMIFKIHQAFMVFLICFKGAVCRF